MGRSMYLCGALFAAIGLAAIAAGVAGADVGSVLFGVMFVAIAALFVWIARWPVNDSSALDDAELQSFGRPSEATVLAVHVPAGTARPTMTLRVTPRNERPFRAQAPAPSDSVPAVGDELRVRFDPNKRTHLVVMPSIAMPITQGAVS